MRNSFIIIITLLLIFSSCRNPSIARDAHVISLIAWNEDTSNSIKLVLYNGNEFYYSIPERSDKAKHYSGNYKRIADSIFLKYYGNNMPQNFTSYLVKETSGDNLVQNFLSSDNRMFLRIQRKGEHFR